MKYDRYAFLAYVITDLMLALNVWFGFTTNNPISWAAAIFILMLLVHQLVTFHKM